VGQAVPEVVAPPSDSPDDRRGLTPPSDSPGSPRGGGGRRPPAVALEGIAKKFGAVPALRDVSLSVAEGEFVCFLGPSGCGKTTLLRIVAGLERQNAGAVRMAGRDVSGLPPSQRNYGIVFQSYALFPNLTVARNVAYGLEARRAARPRIEARVDELLDLVGLRALKLRYPAQLSGGEQQRVALARALAPSPSLLLLDEPLSALDARVRLALRQEMKALQRRLGITTIMVTHDQEEALTMSDRVAVFNEGRVEQVGPPAAVYEQPANAFVSDFVGVSNVLERDGRRFTVRPEKVRLLDESETGDEMHTERGRISAVAYAGMITRYVVALDAGGELQVVRQNLETSSTEALEAMGQETLVGWRPEHTVAVPEQRERKGAAL
jgi:putative spermidine/putrescine transport system ATP-binding protein